MTLAEAKLIAQVCSNCDGGCPVCVESLADDLNETFPEFVWTFSHDTEPAIQVAMK